MNLFEFIWGESMSRVGWICLSVMYFIILMCMIGFFNIPIPIEIMAPAVILIIAVSWYQSVRLMYYIGKMNSKKGGPKMK